MQSLRSSEAPLMASITIRNLDEKTKARLRIRAARHGRSMEEEARTLLRSALTEDATPGGNLAQAIRDRFRRFGGVELRLPAREPIREPPKPGR
jgi:plasmid stability protein